MSRDYYVYTLAYPDGRVFYVGKGSKSDTGFDRIDDHERVARTKDKSLYGNRRKIETIQEIWAHGEEVLKNKVAFFADEREAYAYEWALINMTCYSDRLTNIARAPSVPVPHRETNHKKVVYDTSLQRIEQARKDGYFCAIGIRDIAALNWMYECRESGHWCIIVRSRNYRSAELHGANGSTWLDIPDLEAELWGRFRALADHHGVRYASSFTKPGPSYFFDHGNQRIGFFRLLPIDIAHAFARFFVDELKTRYPKLRAESQI